MIILRRKQFMSPTSARLIDSGVGRWTMNKLIGASRSAEKGVEMANRAAWRMKLDPRGAVKEGAAIVAENPISASGQVLATPLAVVAGSAVGGSTGGTIAAGLPNSLYWVATENGLKKIPLYANGTRAAGRWARTSPTVDAMLGNRPMSPVSPGATLGDRVAHRGRSILADVSNIAQSAGRVALNTVRA